MKDAEKQLEKANKEGALEDQDEALKDLKTAKDEPWRRSSANSAKKK